MEPTVAPIDPGRAPEAADAIAAGFLDNEIWEWILPGGWRRLRMLRRHYRMMIRRVYIPRGGAWMTGDGGAAALWFPPGTYALSAREWLTQARSLLPLGATGLRRAARMDALAASHHPREPHWYLNTIAVRPELQRRGHGSALMAPVLERIDAEGLPAYLETQRESNVPYYRRFGFEPREPISLPDSPPAWPMWRPARAPG